MTDTSRRSDGAPRSNNSLRVFVVDDHPSICEAVADVIESIMDMTVCGEAGAAKEALQKLGTLGPDIAIVDLSLTDMHGVELIRRIHAQYPSVKIIVYSTYDETVYAEPAIRAGASGYLMKGEPTKRLVEAIRAVRRGEMYISHRMKSRILGVGGRDQSSGPGFPIDELTDREMEVFQLIGNGYGVGEICDELDLNRKTVETYRRRAKEKLGLDNVSDLLQYALRWGTVQEGGED